MLETGLGMRPDSPGSVFLHSISDSETHKHFSPTNVAPIESITPLLHAAAIEFATSLERLTEFLLTTLAEDADALSFRWTEIQRSSHMIRGIINNLSNGLGAADWCQGSSPRTKRLYDEYTALLQSSIFLSQNFQSSIQ